MQTNIFNKPLKKCSLKPLTGYLRDGSCATSSSDFGNHSVCAVVTDEFLEYSKTQGNDLMTPMPQFNFPGLKSGDRWCLCAARWKEAYDAGCAPMIDGEATSIHALKIIDKDVLVRFDVSKQKS